MPRRTSSGRFTRRARRRSAPRTSIRTRVVTRYRSARARTRGRRRSSGALILSSFAALIPLMMKLSSTGIVKFGPHEGNGPRAVWANGDRMGAIYRALDITTTELTGVTLKFGRISNPQAFGGDASVTFDPMPPLNTVIWGFGGRMVHKLASKTRVNSTLARLQAHLGVKRNPIVI